MSEEAFLSRWSRRKLEARETEAPPAEQADAPAPQAVQPADATPVAAPVPPEALPAVESLTAQSDFKPFMGTGVPLETRRAGLKKLFADSYFNVPDPFEAYMEDYTKEDPIPIGMLRTLDHARQVLMRDEPPPAEASDTQADAAATAPAADGDPQHDPQDNGAGDGPARQDA